MKFMENKYFKYRKIIIATKHEKEKVMAPILERELCVQVIISKDFDTDQFGTFTGDKKRAGNQLEAARKKALEAMKHAGVDLGISSEGSFGSHPQIPWVSSNLELVLLVDKLNGIEIVGQSRSSETNFSGDYVSSVEEAREVVQKWGFPIHGVVVRNKENGKIIYKGITTDAELEVRVLELLGRIFVRKVFIETDLRAHMNPTRMKNIVSATEDLVRNAKSLCPECGCPGFVIFDVKRELRCVGCGADTNMVSMCIYGCQKCNYKEDRVPTNTQGYADPGECDKCNP